MATRIASTQRGWFRVAAQEETAVSDLHMPYFGPGVNDAGDLSDQYLAMESKAAARWGQAVETINQWLTSRCEGWGSPHLPTAVVTQLEMLGDQLEHDGVAL